MGWASGETVGGRYKLDRMIGEGGMGVVWSAVQLVTRRHVALKALRNVHAADKAVKQRFLREARAACAVRHPNVVEIHDVIELEDGVPVMVMDLLEGESLGQRIERERKIPMPDLVAIMLPVISAVSTAHKLGIIHRDLKPDNVFLSQTAAGVEVKVLDFGIAKMTATEGETAATGALTGTGAMLGTPLYMAPEQIYGDKDVDLRADVWAIGVMLYECFAGVRPTQADSIGQVLKIITRDGIAPLGGLRADLPKEVLDLVGRMLAVDKTKRPGSLAEVAEVLERNATGATLANMSVPMQTIIGNAVSGEFVQAATLQLTPEPLSPMATTTTPTTTTVGTRTKPPPPMLAIAAAAFGVLGIIGAALFFITRHNGTASTPTSTATVHVDPTETSTIPPPPTNIVTTAAIATAAVAAATSTTSPATTPHAQQQGHKPAPSAKPTTTAAPTATAHTPGGVVESAPF